MAHERLFSRAVVRVAPADPAEDAAGFLQGLVTNDVRGFAGLCGASPQGNPVRLIIGRGDGALCRLRSEAAEDLVSAFHVQAAAEDRVSLEPTSGLLAGELGAGGAPTPPRRPRTAMVPRVDRMNGGEACKTARARRAEGRAEWATCVDGNRDGADGGSFSKAASRAGNTRA